MPRLQISHWNRPFCQQFLPAWPLIFRCFQLTIRFSVASNFHKIIIVLFHLLCRPPFLTRIHAILIMLKCFHTHTQRSTMSPLQDYYSWRSWLHDKHCPGKQDKTLTCRKEEKPKFSFCVCCRLPCVVQWRRNRKQLVSASFATTSAGQTKPFSVVMVILPAFRTYVPNTLSQLPRWGCPFNQDAVLVHCKFIGMQECIRTGNSSKSVELHNIILPPVLKIVTRTVYVHTSL